MSKTAADSTQEKPLTRLHDMCVEEVSTVDRAANKRRFLLVKRDGERSEVMEKPTEVVPDGKGGLTAATPAPETSAALAASVESVAKADPVAAPAEPKIEAEAKPADPPAPDCPEPAKPEGLEKGGAKMAKERLTRFKAHLQGMLDILKEIDEPEVTPTAGAAEATEKRDPAPVAPPIVDLSETLSTLAKSVTDLTKVVEGQQATIAKLGGAVPPSNAAPVEGREPTQKFAWPRDMNTVEDKETSFAD